MIGRELSHNEQGCVLGCSWKRSCMINHTSTSQFQCKSYSMSLGNGQQNHWIGWDIPWPRIPVPPCKSKISRKFCCGSDSNLKLRHWLRGWGSIPIYPKFPCNLQQWNPTKRCDVGTFFAPHKTCVWAFFCANPTIQQSSAMQEKKRSSKISKDHQRSKLQIQISLLPARWYWTIAPRKGTRGLPLLKMGWC